MSLCITDRTGNQLLSLENIIYCKAKSCYTIFHLDNNKRICATKTLGQYERLLRDDSFIRVHNSTIINLHHFKGPTSEKEMILLSNGTKVTVSRRRKKIFNQKLKEFLAN